MSPMFVPGPVDVAPEVLAAQTKPMLPHRSKDFEAMFQRTESRLKQLFYTQYRVFQVSASGSGCQEAGMRNFVQESVLCCVNGAFADRWLKVALSNGKQADALTVAWGEAITTEMMAEALRRKHYEAVAIVHNETSTGVENPVKELCAIVHEVSPDTLIMVDAVSSLGGVKIEMDAWGIDFLLTSSQKCLALPPGMSFAGTSDRAMKKAESVSNRGWYFDLLLMEKHRVKDSTPMTPAMAQRTQSWAKAHGMEPLAVADAYYSKTVSTIKNSKNMDISALNKFLLTKGMRIANGYGEMKDKTFRIAHMGEIQMKDVDVLLGLMEEFLAKM